MSTAILVIDVQDALCSGNDACFEAQLVISRINEVIGKARVASVPVIFIQHESPNGLFAKGSSTWQLARGLMAMPNDHYVHKTATDSFHKTNLRELLIELNATDLVVCGMQSDFCVDTTIRRALGLGFPVTLVSDGHTTVDNEILSASQISQHHNVTLSNITSFGPRVRLVPSNQIQFPA